MMWQCANVHVEGIAPTMDYAGQTQAQHSLRNYQRIPSQSQQPMPVTKFTDASASSQQHGTSTYDEDGGLDPFSALLKAGEIVERKDQERQTQHPNE